jgi:hypothetical protein
VPDRDSVAKEGRKQAGVALVGLPFLVVVQIGGTYMTTSSNLLGAIELKIFYKRIRRHSALG